MVVKRGTGLSDTASATTGTFVVTDHLKVDYSARRSRTSLMGLGNAEVVVNGLRSTLLVAVRIVLAAIGLSAENASTATLTRICSEPMPAHGITTTQRSPREEVKLGVPTMRSGLRLPSENTESPTGPHCMSSSVNGA